MKVIVDTSVWIAHFEHTRPEIAASIEQGNLLVHPFVLGEIALGTLGRNQEILNLLASQLPAPKAEDQEVLAMILRFHLQAKGIGWVDAHLMASALLADAELLSNDRALRLAWSDVKQKRGRR